jgi:hypothetical protein
VTLQVTRLGNPVAGASDQGSVADQIFAIPVTVVQAGLAVAIEAAMKDGTVRPSALLMADNGGAPGDVMASYGWSNGSASLSSTVRYLNVPIMAWLEPGDYWVGLLPWTGGQEDLRYDTGVSGDGYSIDGGINFVRSEPGGTGVVSTPTDRQYSLTLVMLAEQLEAITATLAATLANQVGAFAGTVTNPGCGGGGGGGASGTQAVRRGRRRRGRR